ncbi:hypothetical protein [Streptomyces sp. NPDC058295]|uniref:hypothetical protein n=1 Tax=Streptomyces sp. NPDC058295 TaxID=3346431 RepID=UPI0036E0CE13
MNRRPTSPVLARADPRARGGAAAAPILDGLPGDNGLRGRAHGASLLGAGMPFRYIASLELS